MFKLILFCNYLPINNHLNVIFVMMYNVEYEFVKTYKFTQVYIYDVCVCHRKDVYYLNIVKNAYMPTLLKVVFINLTTYKSVRHTLKSIHCPPKTIKSIHSVSLVHNIHLFLCSTIKIYIHPLPSRTWTFINNFKHFLYKESLTRCMSCLH